ncbi:YqjK family protein [Herbaspirillum sp. GCM10030257]|uniref:YqjK family protein n=1 Tax=Herbaspirillum sp. GCM10030257 TaxID=3273393 RepID=UPI00361F0BE8
MNSRLEQAARRRRQLITQCHLQRMQLAAELGSLRPTLHSLQSGWRIVNRVRRHPGWIAVAGLGLALVTPRRIASWMRIGSTGLRTWRSLAPRIQQLLSAYR